VVFNFDSKLMRVLVCIFLLSMVSINTASYALYSGSHTKNKFIYLVKNNKRLSGLTAVVTICFFVYLLYDRIFTNSSDSKGISPIKSVPKKKSSEKEVKFSFNKWKVDCLDLPMYHHVKCDEYGKTALTQKEFERVLNEFFNIIKSSRFVEDSSWINGYSLDQLENTFFVQKLVLPEGSQFAIHADLHSDIHSLIKYLNDLECNGKIEGFKIIDPNFYFVFLGDYSDRGYYGVEVLYTLMRLKIENPERVILLRGNHESLVMNAHYGLKLELNHKFGYETDSFNDFLRLYHFLPVALFVGSKVKCGEVKNFALLCHGGLEPGFNPEELLNDYRDSLFQLIDKLDISWISKNVRNNIRTSIEVTLRKPYKKVIPDIGFRWNDFVDPGVPDGCYLLRNKNRGLAFSRKATEDLLSEYSTDKSKVKLIVSGHQHNGKMLIDMVKNHGIYNAWSDYQWSGVEGEKLSLSGPGSRGCWTMNVAPCSGCGIRKKYNYDTYAVLTLGNKFSDWTLTPRNIEVFKNSN